MRWSAIPLSLLLLCLAPTGARPPEAALPVVHALPVDMLRAGAPALDSGSGFFASPDGRVLTAAHVVRGCGAIHLVSAHMSPLLARVVAVDDTHDIALLQADAPGPAHLPLGEAGEGALRVLGFPAGGPAGAGAARLVNARVPADPALERDPQRLLWLEAPHVAQGYSGGPVLDANGRVVGIVRALVDPARAGLGAGLHDLSIGPGAEPLRAMLGGVAASDNAEPMRAVVRVLCWKQDVLF